MKATSGKENGGKNNEMSSKRAMQSAQARSINLPRKQVEEIRHGIDHHGVTRVVPSLQKKMNEAPAIIKPGASAAHSTHLRSTD